MARSRGARSRAAEDREVRGCYHGHADFLPREGRLRRSRSASPAPPASRSTPRRRPSPRHYNDVAALEKIFAEQGRTSPPSSSSPVVGNMGVVSPPEPGFSRPSSISVEERCGLDLRRGRPALGSRGGMQRAEAPPGHDVPRKRSSAEACCRGLRRPSRHHVEGADRARLPGGRSAGNPIAVSAALCARLPTQPGRLRDAEALGARPRRKGLNEARRRRASTSASSASAWMIAFSKGPCHLRRRGEVGHEALWRLARRDARARTVLATPSQYEAAFISTAHTEAIVDATSGRRRESFGAAE